MVGPGMGGRGSPVTNFHSFVSLLINYMCQSSERMLWNQSAQVWTHILVIYDLVHVT